MVGTSPTMTTMALRSIERNWRAYFSGECTAGSITVECISSSIPPLLFRNACQPGSLPLPPRAAARALRSG